MKKIWLLFILFCLTLNCFVFAENEKIWLRFSDFIQPNFVDILKKRVNIKVDYANLPDDDLQKFVGPNQPFFDIKYEPTDLINLKWMSYISAQTKHQLRSEAAKSLENMANDFYGEFGANIVIASAYRSYHYQKNSISENCKKSWRCAREWESEHQLWLAVDLREATSESKFLAKYQTYYNRLKDNTHLYGFHQSYQKWKEIDGYYIEPRHWRYLWIDLATELYDKNLTFTQYIKMQR